MTRLLALVKFTLIAVACSASTASAGLINLGTANDYNIFVLGNDTQSGTDAEGRVAVKGDANFGGGYSVASKRGGSTTNNLVVGGNYTNTSNVVNGFVTVGGNATITNPTINGNLAVAGKLVLQNDGTINGNVTYGTSINPGYTTTVAGTVKQGPVTVPVNFASDQAYLLNLSQALAGAAETGTSTFLYGGFTLTGTNATSDVFHIKGSDLASATSLTINARAGATVVVNIDGSADQMQNFGLALNGVDRQHVLFNFAQATTLNLSGISIEGSVLAASAAVTFGNGNINGTLVAGSLSGGGEAHDYGFKGNLASIVGPNFAVSPNASVVPEPASILSTIAGLGLVSLARLRRRAGSVRPIA